jgi:phytoene synthase
MEQSRSITRKSASNLALAFILLPREKRDAMSALYAFCRQVDDVADEDAVPVGQRREQLAKWREDVRRACDHRQPEFPVNQELEPVIARYGLPYQFFDELIQGCEMDLVSDRYESLVDLELYCYRVASVVGLLSIEIFGYRDPACRDYAIHLGKALQLTNILRDVRTDALRGRIYLPLADLRRFGVTTEDILAGRYSRNYLELATSVADEARKFYRLARETLPAGDRRSMVAAELMGTVYWRLLQKLECHQFDVFGPEPVRLSKPHKLFLIVQSWMKFSLGGSPSGYA